MPRRTLRPYGHDQAFLLPPSLREWLRAHLDLTSIPTTHGGVTQGSVPSDPRRRVAVLLYAEARGMPASRQIARKLHEDIAFQPWRRIARRISRPSMTSARSICDSIRDLFVSALLLCQRMRRTLRTTRGRRLYAKRASTGEPVFRQIKQGQWFRQFLSRGHRTVHVEWALFCTTHNALMLWTPRRRRPEAPGLQGVCGVKSGPKELEKRTIPGRLSVSWL